MPRTALSRSHLVIVTSGVTEREKNPSSSAQGGSLPGSTGWSEAPRTQRWVPPQPTPCGAGENSISLRRPPPDEHSGQGQSSAQAA